MNSTDKKFKKEFVEKLGNENRKFYETQEGRGILRLIDQTFEHRWLYLFELIQNALDASARSIALHIGEDGDTMIFEHDGNCPFNEETVKVLSKVSTSNKGPSTVGFMGIGFKSIFRRFQEVRVSAWGWTFRYEVHQKKGEKYGDVQTNLLGMVIPIWDSEIVAPKLGFTTRFEMHRRVHDGEDLEADLVRLISDEDLTIFAILAVSNLQRFEVGGRVFELDVSEESDGTLKATVLSEKEKRYWQIFRVEFEPSREAIAGFLEHRKISPTEYAEIPQTRRVLGLLPLNSNGIPEALGRGQGRIYAPLPTDVRLPFGLHINADWLLNTSRSGLREIEDNPWQRNIVDHIADVLADFLDWTAHKFSEPAAVKAAFEVLASPSIETDGLEALFAKECWLLRLKEHLEERAVLPIWTEKIDAVAFAKPSDTLMPPAPLADAFERQPEIRPSILLKGSVLRNEMLGDGAIKFLRQLGFLAEILPQELEQIWTDGLEKWWQVLPMSDKKKFHLLVHIWIAVSSFTSRDLWENTYLPCVRSVTGKWLSVDQVAYIREPLPTENEPGGLESYQFMCPSILNENRLDDNSLRILLQSNENNPNHMLFSQVKQWIGRNAHGIVLREIIGSAMSDLMASMNPNWSIFIPLGHWIKHRERPDLLTHLLVESDGGSLGIPIDKAFLSDPYVEDDQGRQYWFPGKFAVSADYLKQDPKKAHPSEWRAFFERARVKGKLEVQCMKIHADRWERKRVAKFLGLEDDKIDESNNHGYTLLDFDIAMNLSDPNSSDEKLIALAAWIEDGYTVLKGKGRRQASYHYRYPRQCPLGNVPSAWVIKLSEIAWVPCEDLKLRYPKDTLPFHDPVRPDAPVARLSRECLSVLGEEGVKFGENIPEASALRKLLHKLSSSDSKLSALELADLLRECREEITKDEDKYLLKQTLKNLKVPSNGDERVRLEQIVRRVGGNSRGALGGWIVPLNNIEKALRRELEHSAFPWKFPDTTTGSQALDYVQHVWERARLAPRGLASEVRDILPTAYAYCLQDCTEDTSLSVRWNTTLVEAMVFTEGEWVSLDKGEDLYFDNIEDRHFFSSNIQFRTVTGGHLGKCLTDQRRVAEALGLKVLSLLVKRKWHEGEVLDINSGWTSKFDLIYRLLQWVRGNEEVDQNGMKIKTKLSPKHVRKLILEVSIGDACPEQVQVHARLYQDQDGYTLIVAGRPAQFGADAAKELLREFSFGQRADLAADLTGMLTVMDNIEEDFRLAVEKFRRTHAPDFKIPAIFLSDFDSEEAAGSADEPVRAMDTATPTFREGTNKHSSMDHLFSSGTFKEPKRRDSSSTDGSFTRSQAFAERNVAAKPSRKSLKGEIVPNNNVDDSGKIAEVNENLDAKIGDEQYREIVMQYERKYGREPKLGDPYQTGWDICSIDPKTGDIRFIEVKGKGVPWIGDEVVELSRAQAHEAFKAVTGHGPAWYLYVVEKVDDRYRVVPIPNPINADAKWVLSGETWRVLAESETHHIGSDQ